MPKRGRDLAPSSTSDCATPSSVDAVAVLDGADAEWASVCLCLSGSVAAVKAPQLVAALLGHGVSVDLVLTDAAHTLLQASYRGERPYAQLQALVAAAAPVASDTLAAACGASSAAAPSADDGAASSARRRPSLRLWRDADEWQSFEEVGRDPVLHVELAKRNQLLLVAPLCANALACAACGLCHNLLGCVLRAWYYDLEPGFAGPIVERYGAHAVQKPVLVAPAMNTFMWHQRVTGQHLATLEARGPQPSPPPSRASSPHSRSGNPGSKPNAKTVALTPTQVCESSRPSRNGWLAATRGWERWPTWTRSCARRSKRCEGTPPPRRRPWRRASHASSREDVDLQDLTRPDEHSNTVAGEVVARSIPVTDCYSTDQWSGKACLYSPLARVLPPKSPCYSCSVVGWMDSLTPCRVAHKGFTRRHVH
jgi:phosphopantothenoylcysteine decarboxylase